ncbi:DUF2199 domain-containing protein [Taibaiella chishuiensis]|uniref:DUF2199 domain-containing protein n=1 Tax=Taibaiella chishuiensis TaxID=1434707 RepID=A0A2P8CYF6_9BACT|nr:DUF2199 domain-containing protein [Taibaiella chishuiensis]PSK89998.1 hypothetical protein B0I18_1092 [Taibaiella chishuiensis]
MAIFDFFRNRRKGAPSKCAKCGEFHDKLPAIGFTTPFYYEVLNETDKARMATLSEDFCVIEHEEQTDRFIRATLTLQVNDACEDLDYGIWVSLSEKSYDEYAAEFKNNTAGKTYFGRISNDIPEYATSTLELHVQVITKSGGLRPELVPYESDHPFILDWQNGITIAEAEKRINRCKDQSG